MGTLVHGDKEDDFLAAPILNFTKYLQSEYGVVTAPLPLHGVTNSILHPNNPQKPQVFGVDEI